MSVSALPPPAAAAMPPRARPRATAVVSRARLLRPRRQATRLPDAAARVAELLRGALDRRRAEPVADRDDDQQEEDRTERDGRRCRTEGVEIGPDRPARGPRADEDGQGLGL